MSQVVILFASLTGNTQVVAETLCRGLTTHHSNWQINCQNVADVTPKILTGLSPSDLILVGSSTWDDGEFPFEMTRFLELCQAAAPKLKQIKFGCFGCGDSSYGENFCVCVDRLCANFSSWGGQLINEPLKIDGFPDQVETQIDISNWLAKIEHLL